MNKNASEIVAQGRDVELLEQVDEDEWVCSLCRSSNVRHDSMPSMYAGYDEIESCNDCGATSTTDPFTGVVTIRRPGVSA